MAEADDKHIWAGDLLERRRDADFLEAFLVGRMEERRAAGISGSYVINVDAQWGGGKTFFMDRFGAQLEASGHLVARVNAWKDDHADDPFVAVLAAIDEVLLPFTTRGTGKAKISRAWKSVKSSAVPIVGRVIAGLGKTLIKKHVGSPLEELISVDETEATNASGLASDALEKASVEIERAVDAATEALIERFKSANAGIEDFRQRLGTAMLALEGTAKLPLFILVDELDRCRPSYAVALLERVKHLFDAANVVFVFATNTDQLQHSIKGAYGPGFDGFRYLKRFFDRTYTLQTPSITEFVALLTKSFSPEKLRAPFEQPTKFLEVAAWRYDMDLREIQHVTDIIASVVSAWPHNVRIELTILLPLAVAYYRTGACDWETSATLIPNTLSVTFPQLVLLKLIGSRFKEFLIRSEELLTR
jgi:hypothetical protein